MAKSIAEWLVAGAFAILVALVIDTWLEARETNRFIELLVEGVNDIKEGQ